MPQVHHFRRGHAPSTQCIYCRERTEKTTFFTFQEEPPEEPRRWTRLPICDDCHGLYLKQLSEPVPAEAQGVA